MEIARLLKDHHATAGIDRFDVEVGELGELFQPLRAGLVRPDIVHAIAIGGEIDHVADPDRINVFRIGPRRRLNLLRRQVYDPNGTILSTTIVAALIVPGIVHPVGDMLAIGGDLPLPGARHGERCFHITLRAHAPEFGSPVRRRSTGGEDDAFAIGRPTLGDVGARMPGEAFRLAPVGGDYIHVGVATVLPAEGDPASVGRKLRVPGRSLKACQPPSISPIARRDPEVVRMGKGDLGGTNRRLP